MGIEVISEEPYETRDICDTCGCVIADGELDETCKGEAYSLHNTQSQCLAAVTAERAAAVKLLAGVGAPISYWFVTNMGQCLYCNANETPAGIPHKPDCLTVRIKALLAKEATQ